MTNITQYKFCPDNCPSLMHSVLNGGFCADIENKPLNDYDVNAHLVKYKRDEKCPRKDNIQQKEMI